MGVATGGIWVYIPPKSVQINFLLGRNDVRTSVLKFYTSTKNLYPPKQISGYAPAHRQWKGGYPSPTINTPPRVHTPLPLDLYSHPYLISLDPPLYVAPLTDMISGYFEAAIVH